MNKKIALAGYILIMTGVFLYYLFPSEAVTVYLNSKLSQELPEYHFTATQIRPAFPPGVAVYTPQLHRKDKPFIRLDQLVIRPKYLTLFSKNKALSVAGSIDSKQVTGLVTLHPDTGLIQVEATWDQIDINAVPALKALTPHSVSGRISGKAVFTNQSPFGSGNADFSITQGKVEFKPAVFGMNQLELDTITAKASLKASTITIDALEVKGRTLNGKATGTIQLTHPLSQSRLNISGQAMPTPGLMKTWGDMVALAGLAESGGDSSGIPFQITGTFEAPNFSFR